MKSRMKHGAGLMISAGLLLMPFVAAAQSGGMQVPGSITAGQAFTVPTSGSGSAEFYIVGPGQALRRKVKLGEPVRLAPGVLYSAGRYLVILDRGTSTDTAVLDVNPKSQPKQLAFLAAPSRIPVDVHDGISGTAYIFDAYRNLILRPMPVSFDLADSSGKRVAHVVATSRYGVAWTRMNSAAKEAEASFTASVEGAKSKRVIDQVPGEPCSLSMTAKLARGKLDLQTAPVLDCSGNPVPDGTIVTFTERLNGKKCSVDVPLKKGIASTKMPAWDGATISVASGVMAGNEIRWRGRQR